MNIIQIPARLIKQAAAELGMVEIEQDAQILAAIDDYFKTLNDGQYSPLSGENNNASNSTEVYYIAKKHGVDPSKLMKYLGDTAMFDKFQELSINESYENVTEMSVTNPLIINKVLKHLFRKGYDKHVLNAINDFHKRNEKAGKKIPGLAQRIARTYSINPNDFMSALDTFNKEANTMESRQVKGFAKV